MPLLYKNICVSNIVFPIYALIGETNEKLFKNERDIKANN